MRYYAYWTEVNTIFSSSSLQTNRILSLVFKRISKQLFFYRLLFYIVNVNCISWKSLSKFSNRFSWSVINSACQIKITACLNEVTALRCSPYLLLCSLYYIKSHSKTKCLIYYLRSTIEESLLKQHGNLTEIIYSYIILIVVELIVYRSGCSVLLPVIITD